eukprot:TRINITY_DN44958_c0_g1_i1.p1 TRINITY_DN44958_c0_g1~~TRINITY_DN44958_c0_g1_i1.p1  ORF type:complete len:552 (-),score=113.10 TRINITY_DN44958_c0_g1_i1:20-1675(-)
MAPRRLARTATGVWETETSNSGDGKEDDNAGFSASVMEFRSAKGSAGGRASVVAADDWNDTLQETGLDKMQVETTVQASWIESLAFDLIIGTVILVNAICIGLELDLKTKDNEVVWLVLENVFCVIWILEAVLKLWHFKCAYFKDPWNYLDLFLVMLSMVDAWLMPALGDAASLGPLRMLRMIRLLRLMKLMRVMKMSRNLWLLVQGFFDSFSTLNWVFILIAMLMYAFAIFLRTSVDCNGETFKDWSECDELLGNIPKIMYSLFQIMTLESWSMGIGRPLSFRQPAFFIVMLLYLGVTTFGLLNIIVGVIVENTLNVAGQNADLQKKRKQRQLLRELEILRGLFEAADVDGSGTMDKVEFGEILQIAEVKNALLRMEVPIDQPEALFDLIDVEKDGEFTFPLFAKGVQQVRGPPTSLDMKAMLIAVSGISKRQIAQQNQAQQIADKLDLIVKSYSAAPKKKVSPEVPEGTDKNSFGRRYLPGFKTSPSAETSLVFCSASEDSNQEREWAASRSATAVSPNNTPNASKARVRGKVKKRDLKPVAGFNMQPQ